MADALLAGLPRIVRASDEIRLRGFLAIAIAISAAAWWAVQWLLDQPVEPGRTWLFALVVAAFGALAAAVNVRRRLRAGLREPHRPTARIVWETRAAGKDRRIRFSGALFLTVMVVLMFDALAGWGGITAGVVIGAGLAAGVADLAEARGWRRAERERESELYVLIGPHALAPSWGRVVLYENPADEDDPDRRPRFD